MMRVSAQRITAMHAGQLLLCLLRRLVCYRSVKHPM
jgi:hypothetical protein